MKCHAAECAYRVLYCKVIKDDLTFNTADVPLYGLGYQKWTCLRLKKGIDYRYYPPAIKATVPEQRAKMTSIEDFETICKQHPFED